MDPLSAVTPIDGRYSQDTNILSPYFSELALIRYRIMVEVEYIIYLSDQSLPLKPFVAEQFKELMDPEVRNKLRSFCKVTEWTIEKAKPIKKIEKTVRHDVKAAEYFTRDLIKSVLKPNTSYPVVEYVHFGLTSQDVNNTAIPMMLRDAIREVYIPHLDQLLNMLKHRISHDWKDCQMIGRTHGQPATPTSLAAQYDVFHDRLTHQLEALRRVKFSGKFGGATGGMNAHKVAFGDSPWPSMATEFVQTRLHLDERQRYTSQIEHYDRIAELFDVMCRIHTILLDMARDTWQYISYGYFAQKIIKGEVGSSAMPHKVNPIDFENAEGNLGMANAVLQHMARKLPISRLQRDLSDSTVLRNIGVPFSYAIIALHSLVRGFNRIEANAELIRAELEKEWDVLAEAIQTILRRDGYPEPYEALKELTRTEKSVSREVIQTFIQRLDPNIISEETREKLLALTPNTYTGYYP